MKLNWTIALFVITVVFTSGGVFVIANDNKKDIEKIDEEGTRIDIKQTILLEQLIEGLKLTNKKLEKELEDE